jgi:hypothetical protein
LSEIFGGFDEPGDAGFGGWGRGGFGRGGGEVAFEGLEGVDEAVLVGEELGHAAGEEAEVGGAGDGFLFGGDEGIDGVGGGRDGEAVGGGVAEEALDVGGVAEGGAVVGELDAGEALDGEVLVEGGGAELGDEGVEEELIVVVVLEEQARGVL